MDEQGLREQGEAFLGRVSDTEAEVKLLRTENKAMAEQLQAVNDDNERLRSRVEQLVGRLDTVLRDSNADKELLEKVGNLMVAGLKARQNLRGSPQRELRVAG